VRFLLNGETQECGSALTVQQLLEQRDWSGRRVAVAINASVVPRSSFAQAPIRDGDRVEVLQAVGGG
jgi:sulfur carrier protein